MSIKPILFNTDMVRAIQDGRKTVTRRLLKLNLRENECSTIIVSDKYTGEFCYVEVLDEWENEVRRIYSPYSPGDILWVRETWGIIGEMDADEMEPGDCMFAYKADQCSLSPRWRPSIHMPRKAARIFLRVKSVRAEHLKDITDEQAIAEGARYTDFGMFTPRGKMSIDGGRTFHPFKPIHHPGYHFKDVVRPEQCFDSPRLAFANYWGKIIKPDDLPLYCWDANPPVLVNEFERCEKPEGFDREG